METQLSIKDTEFEINFKTALKLYPDKGNLVYEYNPLHNYRLDKDMYLYRERFYTQDELEDEGITLTEKGWNGVPEGRTPPQPYQKGLLVDFITDELHFDINHPVNIIPSYSYDNSVDLIINDGKSAPKLINTRFSATEKNLYLIIDRQGNNDTNIYDMGEQFDVDTSLYKKITTIPELLFLGISHGGNLSIGNYNFYFKYADDDGNESDFFAESGQVLVFIGTHPTSVYSGFREENSHKAANFAISNLDKAYQNIVVYYTRATSDINENVTVNAYRINTSYAVTNAPLVQICINGYEEVTEVPIEEINELLLRYSAVETQAICQNRLFFAHNYKIKLNYDELRDIALRFIPSMDTSKQYTPLNSSYFGNYSETYFDPTFSYKYTGYWSDIYRFGIVFIYSDNTLSDVYNVRGCSGLGTSTEGFTNVDFHIPGSNKRNYIQYDENNYSILSEGSSKGDTSKEKVLNENCLGVIQFKNKDIKLYDIIGIKFTTTKEVLSHLRDILKIRGFFFVRLKRIPTILCQAFTIGIDDKSNVPAIPRNLESAWVEGFLDKGSRALSSNFLARIHDVLLHQLRKQGAICPEYDVNSPYFNSLFTGGEFVVEPYDGDLSALSPSRLINVDTSNLLVEGESYNVRIIGVEDNTKLVAIGDNKFSARAGEAEEAFRYAYIGQENKSTEASNLVRGSYGPYLGIVGYEEMGKLVNIRIPHYTESDMSKYFTIRFNDPSPYYAISGRYDLYNNYTFPELSKLDEEWTTPEPLYRGDCFICNYTHRLNRNFQDPSAPTNDDIVDPWCWANNYAVEDGVVKKENFDNINLGDVNAVQLGTYIHMVIRSNMNLNIRAIDESIPDETGLTGHPRVFSPYCLTPIEGAYKTPEALCYNKGFEKSVSEKIYFRLADVPYYKEDFTNRISYSNIKINDSFLNGFRVFKGTNYRDYPKTYGSITKLIELRGNLLCVFEHGVGLISVNERAVAGEGSGGPVYINTSNILPENPKIISDTYGSLWRDSVVKTPNGVYGVDTIGKKIWRTNGETFECISDFRILEFLNLNISLTEREVTPIIGIRNVKTHYNAFKGDVMFTFYDNLYGFEERVWNICFNEKLLKWVTFYSWVPSESENIYNQFFSFDRNTSKWIAKLGINKKDSDFADGIVLDNVVITGNGWVTKLSLTDYPSEEYDITYGFVRDINRNDKLFKIHRSILMFTGNYEDIKAELYERDDDGKIKIDENGRRVLLKDPKNANQIVRLLNIRATITRRIDKMKLGSYDSTIAVIPEYNLLFLTTDFWKHGQAGIIDISDKILPTHWYGKKHPFEFEFVVADNPDKHKIFDNLEIISNKAAPESFHYEIVGECYEFAKDKKNMYIRQEATKELYQYNGSDIVFDPAYKKLNSEHRPLTPGDPDPKVYDKSTIFPLYYCRLDKINEIEDYYELYGHKDHYGKGDKNFSALAGAEIVKYDNLDEYRIWNHAKAVDVTKEGLARGNMYYKEDKWDVQINPLNFVLKNETKDEWLDKFGSNAKEMVPAELNLFKEFKLVGDKKIITSDGTLELPNDWERNVISWSNYQTLNKEAKMKDKFIKIRIRYSGDNLAIISAIKTLYSISYA